MNEGKINEIVSEIVAQIQQQQNLTDISLEIARKLASKIEAKAKSIGVKCVVAVYNSSAHPILVECTKDSYIASYDIAVNKAYTSVALKMPTKELKKLSQPGAELYGIQFTNGGKIVIFGGGEPLYYKGKIIGGLGVSGGSEEQDTALAEYGVKALNEILNL